MKDMFTLLLLKMFFLVSSVSLVASTPNLLQVGEWVAPASRNGSDNDTLSLAPFWEHIIRSGLDRLQIPGGPNSRLCYASSESRNGPKRYPDQMSQHKVVVNNARYGNRAILGRLMGAQIVWGTPYQDVETDFPNLRLPAQITSHQATQIAFSQGLIPGGQVVEFLYLQHSYSFRLPGHEELEEWEISAFDGSITWPDRRQSAATLSVEAASKETLAVY